MPITNTQDEWAGRRIDVRHINPSIMEGERGHSSMFGQGSAVVIVRYAPSFNVQPSISGSFKIPSVLTCNPGVIDASPQAQLYFQWKADGVDLVGETNATITTTLAFDEVELTCEVTAVNPLGVAVGESNGITAEAIEPIINHEYMHYAVTGLDQEMQQNAFGSQVLITSGISMSQRIDMQQHIILIPTGMWVKERLDMMSETLAVIQGLEGTNQGQLYGHDVYAYWQPTILGDIGLINGGAETGDLTGWTVTAGTITAESTAQQGTSLPSEGSWYFSAHTSLQGEDAAMQQTVVIDGAHTSDIDAGLIYMKMVYKHDNYTDNYNHEVRTTLSVLDASDNVLYSEQLYQLQKQNWNWATDYTDAINLPVGSRKVRVNVSFLTGTNRTNNSYMDSMSIELLKDEHQT